MKTFYTVRDIEDMHAAGVAEIEIHDDVVLTDVAREKAIALGMSLRPAKVDDSVRQGGGMPRTTPASHRVITSVVAGAMVQPPPAPPAAPSRPPAGGGPSQSELVGKIKAAVVSRLGTDKYNDILDQIIPQVMAQLKK
ncbi:MAG TPA: hypothetical protein VK852_14325 [Desulfobacterales bacterium]|jgi:hypothetical protein|nr:hypothetical protein [Desulfobacterales bacterium]